MIIQAINNYNKYEIKSRQNKKKVGIDTGVSKKTGFVKDSYEPDKAKNRIKFLSSIKKKVKAGYYSSKDVVDDLSDSFAKAFNERL